MLSLTPSIKLSTHRFEDINADESDLEYQKIRGQVLKRDNYTCQYCGFHVNPDITKESHTLLASGYLELHHQDDDHTNNAPDNLVSTCPFCHSVWHLGFAGKHGRVKLAFVPYLTQAEVNLFSNLIGIIKVRHKNSKDIFENRQTFDKAIQLERLFVYGEDVAERVFGDGASNPIVFSSALAKLNAMQKEHGVNIYEKRTILFHGLGGIRVVPNLVAFSKQIEFWSNLNWLPSEFYEDEWKKLRCNQ